MSVNAAAEVEARLDALSVLDHGWYDGSGTPIGADVLDAARTFTRTLEAAGAATQAGNRIILGPGLGEPTGIEIESPVCALREFDVSIGAAAETVGVRVTLWNDDDPNDDGEGQMFSDPAEAARFVAEHVTSAHTSA